MNFKKFLARKKSGDKTIKKSLTRARKEKKPKRSRTLLMQDGLAILVIGALLVFNAAARGINLLLALGAFFVGFLAIDYLWGKTMLERLRVTRKLPGSAYVGEPFYVEIEVDASKRKSSAWAIVVEDTWAEEEEAYDAPRELKKNAAKENLEKEKTLDKKNDKKKTKRKKLSAKEAVLTDAALREGVETLKPVVYFPDVPYGEKRKEYYVGVFTRRGIRRLKEVTISTRFPCGFFRSSERIDMPDEIIVFPKIGRLANAWENFAGKVAREASVSTSWTSRVPDETVAIRDWRQGDSKKNVAWRATAKRNRLQARDFTKRQTRTIVLILDLFLAPNDSKEKKIERWKNVEKAIAFSATLIKRYTEGGDSQLYFTLNADVPTIGNDELVGNVRGKINGMANVKNDAPNDWDAVVGGGSIRRAFTRLALAMPPKQDKIHETIHAAKTFNLKDSQVFVVSPEPIDEERFEREHWGDARYIDVSDPAFDDLFQMNADANEDNASA